MTIYLCAVDVGLKYHAQAWFRDGDLILARLMVGIGPIPAPSIALPADILQLTNGPGSVWWDADDCLIIESATCRPRDGAIKKREVDALNRAAGRLGGLHPDPLYVLPEWWHGTAPKKLAQRRARGALSETELAVLPKKQSELHHVLDAVGIGLRALGRS